MEALTDNRNRTAADVRHYFDKYGGKMGQCGSVMFIFEKQGIIIVDKENVSEEKLMEDALEAGAVDFLTAEEYFDIRTAPNDVGAVREALEKMGYKLLSAEAEYVPNTEVKLEKEEDIKNMLKCRMFETTTMSECLA